MHTYIISAGEWREEFWAKSLHTIYMAVSSQWPFHLGQPANPGAARPAGRPQVATAHQCASHSLHSVKWFGRRDAPSLHTVF